MKSLRVPIASFLAGALLMLAMLWMVVGYPEVEHVPVRIHEARLEVFFNQSDLGPLPTELLDALTGEVVGISDV